MKTQGAQFLKKRKLLLMLPLLTLPFITIAFWAMGGGSGSLEQPSQQAGINPALPDAKPSPGPTDKMSLYDQAAKDSLAIRQSQGFGPYSGSDDADTGLTAPINSGGDPYSPGLRSYADPNEVKVQERLASLERALREPLPPPQNPYGQAGGYAQGQTGIGADLDRLEQMMQSMGSNGKTDPEMQQLNEMMEKVLDLQYPDRAQQKLQERSQRNRGRVYPVIPYQEQLQAGIIARPYKGTLTTDKDIAGKGANAFYGLAEASEIDTAQTAIPAVIHETQTLVSGGTIKMRLVEDIFISGMLIPAGNFLFGTCSVNGERLKIEISGVRYGKSLYPVALSVYDLDAIEGIRIPGALTRDAAKEGSDRALQSVQLMSLDPSIGAQAAGAGVEVAKGLFGKKAKLVRVTVKAGYPVLLMDAKTRQQQTN